MIRSTRNEGYMSASKQTATPDVGHTGTGTKSQSYELVEGAAGGKTERRDEFGAHASTESLYPSNGFNGTFE